MSQRRMPKIGLVFAVVATLLAAAWLAVGSGPAPVKAVSGGPVVLMGIDAEDGGPGGHGPIANYVSVVNSLLGQATNGGSGIVVFGCGKSAFDGPTTFWNAISTGTGASVTCVNGAANVGSQSLAGFEVVAVVSDEFNTGNGLTNAENGALSPRASDIAAFVNGGGGLLGFSSDFCVYGTTACYGYLGQVGTFTVTVGLGYSDIAPTPAGAAIGITDALDICCWHDVYNSYPPFLNLLATDNEAFSAGFGQAAAIGGAQVVLQPENCNNGVDDDGDGLIDQDDPDCQVPPPPPTENCTNGIDDDGDGLIDQDDPDCQVPPGDTTAPLVGCVETVNPHGKRVPPAGNTTPPGNKGGQNEDGFYLLEATDDTDPHPQVFVVDMGSTTVFGPFTSGTNIKYTQAPGAKPNQKKIGSINGDANAVSWHITGKGDMGVFAVDASGNQSATVACLVPPPPK
ncbi:MAG: hypothetical protein HY686_06770 [Chloroflexi bacterium]|nr:hypothetical protein [Chloroflexota bacterium]